MEGQAGHGALSELLFTLRGMDAADLVSSTGAGLSAAGAAPGPGKILDDAALGEVPDAMVVTAARR